MRRQETGARRHFDRLVSWALLIGTFVFSMTLAETALRWFLPQKLSINVSQWDPDVGFSLRPNAVGFSETPEYVMHVSVNSHGLRDAEYGYAKPPHTFRVGVFGDSFTFGEGVEAEAAYPKLLERYLNRDAPALGSTVRVEVLNFGIGKTGTSHQYAWYRKEGRKYGLDLVILGFLAGNDFEDNWGGVYRLKNNVLVHNPTSYSSIRKLQRVVQEIPLYDWAVSHSHLVNLARAGATILDDRIRTQAGRSANGEDGDLVEGRKLELTLRLIEAFRDQALTDQSRFLFVNLPGKGQQVVAQYGQSQEIPPHILSCAAVLNHLRTSGVDVLDLVPTFAKLPTETHYFVHDGHMTVTGHRVVARELAHYIGPIIAPSYPEAVAKSGL
ncbi:MAG: hypothetical protein GDA67_06130 [Nitrospira sp. CR1.3]|nr:hypothetical protein [Nitrospira sp. CR1.3]